jgi:hypothetical protein
MSLEEKFLTELNIFKNEVILLSKYLYMELTIRTVATTNKRILTTMNKTPTFWNTVLSGFQNSTFITLGRIFDTNSKHNIHILFKVIEDNKFIFSKKSFEKRWLNNEDVKNSKMASYLSEYMKNFYEPTDKDFRELKKLISKQKKIYETIYRPIRNHFGHKKYSTNEEIQALFDKVNISELEKFCTNLEGLHEALWQLYYNGRGPLLPIKQSRYSTKNILKTKFKKDSPITAKAQFVAEAKLILSFFSKK